MNVLSLFDGISCGRVACDRAGIKVDSYFASEIDPYAIKIAQANYPDTVQLGDVNDFDKWVLPKIELLIGGSPCQDLSIAKKDRKGLDGNRSGLFWRYVDCLNNFKPKWFLLENVASMPKVDRDKITEVLGVEPIMINSALVSAQQRKRLYWTNIPNITQPEDKGIFLKDILEANEFIRIPEYGDGTKARPLTAHYSNNCGGWIDRVNDTNPAKQQVDLIAQPIRIGQIGRGGQGDRIYSVRGKSVLLNANGGGRGAKTGLYKIDLPDGDYIIRKLTPLECERLQTLPDGYTDKGVSNTQRYKAIGNGWTIDVIAHILSFIPKEEN